MATRTRLSDIDLFGGTTPTRTKGRGGAASGFAIASAAQLGGGPSTSGGSSPLDPLVKKKVMGAVRSKGDLKIILESDAPDAIKEYARKVYQGREARKPNPDKSLLHAVTHNPLTDIVGGALKVVPMGMRAIVATAEEVPQAVVGYDDGRSWADKVTDENYGAKAVLTAAAERGDPLAQRMQGFAITPSSVLGKNLPQLHADSAFGLVGDVALDPLSYVTAPVKAVQAGATVGKGLTRGEQALRYAKLAETAATDAEKANLLGLANKVLKHGSMSSAELELAGMRGGLRIGGKSLGFGHDGVSKLTAPIRRTQQAAWNVGGNTFLNHFGADELAEARKLIHLSDDPTEVVQGLWAKHAGTAAKQRSTYLEAVRTEELATGVRDAHEANVPGKLLADAMDGDSGAIAMLESGHPGVLDRFRKWTDLAHDQLGLGERRVENYFPRVFNSQVDVESPAFRKLFKGTVPSPHELTRLTVGDRFGSEVLGSDKLVKAYGPVVRHQMEGVWKELGNDVPLFVDDAYEALPRYSHAISDRVKAKIRTDYLIERGVIADRPIEVKPIKGAVGAEKAARKKMQRALTQAESAAAKADELGALRDQLAVHEASVVRLREAAERVDEVAAQPHDPKAAALLVAERKAAARRLAAAEKLVASHQGAIAKLEARGERLGAAASDRSAQALEVGLAKERRGLTQDMADVAQAEVPWAEQLAASAASTADGLQYSIDELQQAADKMVAKYGDTAAPVAAAPVASEAELAAARQLLEDHLGVTDYNKAVKAKRSTEGIAHTPLDQVDPAVLERNATIAEGAIVRAQEAVDKLTLAVENGGGPGVQAELRAAQVNLDHISGVAAQQRAAADAAKLLESAKPDPQVALLESLAEKLDNAEMKLEEATADRVAAGRHRETPAERTARRELGVVRNELRRNGLPTEGEALAAHIDEMLGGADVSAVSMSDKPPFNPGAARAVGDERLDPFNWHANDGMTSSSYAPFEEMQGEWAALGPDDPVVVYHGADDPRNIKGLRESGKVDLQGVDGHMRGTSDNRGIKEVGGLYVTLNPALAAGYGDHVVSMVVPKRLIKPSSEVLWGAGELKIPGVTPAAHEIDWYQRLFFATDGDKTLAALLDGEGAVLPHGTPLADVVVHPQGQFREFALPSSDMGALSADVRHAVASGGDVAAAAAAPVDELRRLQAEAVARADYQSGLARHLGTVAHKHRLTLGEELVLPEAPKAVQKAAAQYDELKPVLDQAREAEALVSGDTQTVIAALQRRLDQLDVAIEGAKNPTRAANLKAAKAARTDAKASLERALGEDGPTVKFVLGLDAAASEAEAQLREAAAHWTGALEDFVSAKNAPKFKEVFAKELGRGMALFPEDQSKMWPKWMQDAAEQMVPVSQSNKLIEGIDWFNRVFKAQATLSPGFHVRNFYSAVFMNMVHGVSLSEMRQWHKALTAYRKGGIDAVEASLRPYVTQVVENGFLTSGTRWSHELSAMGEGRLTGHVGDFSAVAPQSTWDSLKSEAKGNLVTKRDLGDNPVNRVSNFAGVRVEQFARSVLAFHDLKGGLSIESAWERVAHLHFDYTDLSSLESNVLKRVIPFWTWSSRNLPLQIEAILSKPKWYSRFLSVKRNVELSAGPMDPLTPRWLSDKPSAIRVSGDQWLTPDLPFAGAQELSSGLRSEGPLAVLKDVAPIFRLPFEVKAGKQSFGDIPLSDKPVPLPTAWLPLVPAIKGATGDSVVFKDRKSGEWRINGKHAYMLESMFPLLGRARRLAPNDPKYQERAIQSWLGFMGLGGRKVSQRDKENTTFQVSDDLRSQVKWLENHGYDTRSAFQRSQDYQDSLRRGGK